MQYREDFYAPFPLFIRNENEKEYEYFGHYKEPCGSDKLSWNEMSQVPKAVKLHWATELGKAPRDGKPVKTLTALREMWPTKVVGLFDSETGILEPCDVECDDPNLATAKTFISADEAEAITTDQISRAFNVVSTSSGRTCTQLLTLPSMILTMGRKCDCILNTFSALTTTETSWRL